MNAIFHVLAMAVVSTSVQPDSDWTPYARGVRYEAFYNPSTVRRNGQNVTVWAKDQMFNPEQEGYSFVVALDEFDCARGRKRTLQETTYRSDGAALETITEPEDWEYVTPGTIGGQLANLICESGAD